jgi:hypothetical protein
MDTRERNGCTHVETFLYIDTLTVLLHATMDGPQRPDDDEALCHAYTFQTFAFVFKSSI